MAAKKPDVERQVVAWVDLEQLFRAAREGHAAALAVARKRVVEEWDYRVADIEKEIRGCEADGDEDGAAEARRSLEEPWIDAGAFLQHVLEEMCSRICRVGAKEKGLSVVVEISVGGSVSTVGAAPKGDAVALLEDMRVG